jgi:hypothetical protein
MFNFSLKEYESTPLLKAVRIFLLLCIIVGIGLLLMCERWVPLVVERATEDEVEVKYDPKNIVYTVEGETFALENGEASKEVTSGAPATNDLTLFGEPTYGDVDGDGDDDALVILVNNPGGIGNFFYATLAVNIDGIYTSLLPVLLGDRVAPQTARIYDSIGEVNYAKRMDTDDYKALPAIAKTLRLKLDAVKFRLIAG